jgi:DNA-binding transcriptional MerR regulator
MVRNQLFIGELAKRSGVNPTTIRYYEAIGLLRPAPRGENRYRLYSTDTVELIQFIAKAKALGFTLVEIGEVVGIHQRGSEPCHHVQSLLRQKVADLDRMLIDLVALRRRLKRLLAGWTAQGGRLGTEAVVCPHIEGGPNWRNPTRGDRGKAR